MAYLVMKSGKKSNVTVRRGLNLWNGINHPEEASERQIEFIKQIKQLYLNWTTAPADYIEINRDRIIPLVINEWTVDRTGRPTRPGSDFMWAFAKEHGFWAFGAMAEDVRTYVDTHYFGYRARKA